MSPSAESNERPAAAVLLAWGQLQDALFKTVARHGLRVERPVRTGFVYQNAMELANAGLITRDFVNLISEMQSLRNKVAEMKGFEPDEDSVKNYVKSAEFITNYLARLQDKASP